MTEIQSSAGPVRRTRRAMVVNAMSKANAMIAKSSARMVKSIVTPAATRDPRQRQKREASSATKDNTAAAQWGR